MRSQGAECEEAEEKEEDSAMREMTLKEILTALNVDDRPYRGGDSNRLRLTAGTTIQSERGND